MVNLKQEVQYLHDVKGGGTEMKKALCCIMTLCLLMGLFTSVSIATADDEPITVTLGKSISPSIEYREGEGLNNNTWTQAYEEAGVKVEYTLTSTSDQYSQKLALAIASGDLPDIWASDKKNFYLALEADLAYDLTDLFNTELSDLSHQYMDEYDMEYRAATVDGRLMAIPVLVEDPTSSARVTFIRHDWLVNLGLDIPTTQQELVDTMIAFATQDPDGNGEDDTIGFAFQKDLWGTSYSIEGFFNHYHAYTNIWYEDDYGNLIYGTVQAEPMKAALSDLAKLYAAGAIDKEFIVKDSDQVAEDIVNQKVGVIQGRWWNFGGAITKAFMADPDKVTDRWWCIDPVSVDDQPVLLESDNSAPNTFYVVNKNTEHPEAIFTLLNTWFEKCFSPDLTQEEYRLYTVDTDVKPQNWAFITPWPYLNPRVTNIAGVNAGTIDPDTLTGESAQIWENIVNFKNGNYYNAAYDHYWNHSLEDHTSMQIRMRLVDRNGTVSNLAYGPNTESMTMYMSTLEQLRDETIVKIITGAESVDYFDKFVDDWYALGGQDIVDEMNEWYATTK